jgi:hypothetical protein
VDSRPSRTATFANALLSGRFCTDVHDDAAAKNAFGVGAASCGKLPVGHEVLVGHSYFNIALEVGDDLALGSEWKAICGTLGGRYRATSLNLCANVAQ